MRTSAPPIKTTGQYDLAKYVLSIMIVAIHTNLLSEYLYPWLRIAVPLFFMISSYFFFMKVNSTEHKEACLRKFVLRNLKLYAFWFLALLPSTLILRRYFQNGIFEGLLRIVLNFLFQSTFPASWFIMGLIIGTCIVYYFRKQEKTLLTVSLLIYAVCCLLSNYGAYFKLPSLYGMHIYNSFPVAIIWILIGKMFAENKISISRMVWIALLPFSIVCLYAEYLMIQHLDCSQANDCYFGLLLLCPVLFALLQKANTERLYPLFRKASTIYYCSHITIGVIMKKGIEMMNIEDNYHIYCFFFTVIVCTVCYAAIFLLQRREHFNWLKYAY